jgi:NADPH-dependent stearoyl-CoA 9-desaturase
VRELCERYDLPYTSGPLLTQYAQVWRKILRLSLPGGGGPPQPAPEKAAGADGDLALSAAA